jgi:2-polyprenyl-6-methoxyphenol hydroxylase-like FAD-dependent oxidoreductase
MLGGGSAGCLVACRLVELRHEVAIIDQNEGRDPSHRFDTSAYLRRYADVAENGSNPLLHYLRHGEAEGDVPSAPTKAN